MDARRAAAMLALLSVACATPRPANQIEMAAVGPASLDVAVGRGAAGADGAAAGADQAATAPAVPAGRAVWVAEYGVDTPWFAAVTEAGAAQPVQVGPLRGAGYGVGEATVAYPQLTPDGRTLVVVVQPLAGPDALYALAVDGSMAAAPVKIADAPQLSALERHYTDTQAAWVSAGNLYRAALDGTQAGAPVLVAEAPAGTAIERPRWLPDGKRLAFVAKPKLGNGGQAYAALADGSQAKAPQLLGPAGQSSWVVDVLADGRVVVAADRLYAAAPDTGIAVALTPLDGTHAVVGIAKGGKRIVTRQHFGWKPERRLYSVATDGSEATAPIALSDPALDLEATMSRDGQGVAWSARGTGNNWAVFIAAADGSSGPAGQRVSAWQGVRPRVTAALLGKLALVGTDGQGAVQRWPLPGGPDTQPVVLHTVPQIVNQSGPWPVLSTAGAQVIFDANTPQGWKSWTVPLTGGPATTLPGAWYRDLVTPFGVVVHAYTKRAGLFAAAAGGAAKALTGWHEASIQQAQLVADGSWALYACAAPKPGWYAAPTGASAPAARWVMPVELPPGQGLTLPVPAILGDHVLALHNGKLDAWPLTPASSGLATPVLASGVSQFLVHAERAVAVQNGKLLAVAPGKVAVAVLNQGDVQAVAAVPGTNRVVAALGKPGQLQVVSARLDGSDAAAPPLLADAVPGLPLALLPTLAADRLVLAVSIEATAVSKPDLLLTAALSAPAPVAVTALAPKGHWLWGTNWMFEGFASVANPGVWQVPGGKRVLLTGPQGLMSARLDGSDATQPLHLGPGTRRVGAPYSPDGNWVLTAEGKALQLARPDQPGSQQALTPPLPQPVAEAVWTADAKAVVFRASGDFDQPEGAGQLYRADLATPAVQPQPLLPAGQVAVRLYGLTPDGTAAVWLRRSTDHSLFLAPVAAKGTAAPSIPLTPVDDVAEQLVGFVPGP